MTAYRRFLEAKIKLDPGDGIEVDPARLNPALKLFTQASVRWLLRGGRRALFSSFGLHKTVTQLEVMRLAPVDVPRSILAPMVLQRMITRVGEWAVGEALKVLGLEPMRAPAPPRPDAAEARVDREQEQRGEGVRLAHGATHGSVVGVVTVARIAVAPDPAAVPHSV